MQTATFILALAAASTALVARQPKVPMNGGANTLIEYQPWCPVCDTVALNKKCLSEGASCMSSTFMPGEYTECETGCSSACQRTTYVANSDVGYTCNTTRSSTN